ncbi:MAG: Type II secretion system protein G [Candidatus Celerinatantimonas neptuna]|nr:MAG: Type II secretion system protein G [Candidatus Celerinatantimonas neptuna]
MVQRQQKRRNKGFSLLEVMVVIVIIGLMATLIVPNLMGNKEKADQKKALADIVALENALDMYKLDNGVYPTTEQGLEALVVKPQIAPIPRDYRSGGYIRRLPEDPWGKPYQLLSPGEHGAIDVYSDGPDRQAGTKDDIGNWNIK